MFVWAYQGLFWEGFLLTYCRRYWIADSALTLANRAKKDVC